MDVNQEDSGDADRVNQADIRHAVVPCRIVSQVDIAILISQCQRVPSEFLQAFGHVVRNLRTERGITQAELAERLGLGRTSVTNLESGTQNPPLSLLPEIAHALGVDPTELISITLSQGDDTLGDPLLSRVPDTDLRRWAKRLISDTTSSPTPELSGRRYRRGPK
jgi:transcriptional regulator with XRE-family HTH domain